MQFFRKGSYTNCQINENQVGEGKQWYHTYITRLPKKVRLYYDFPKLEYKYGKTLLFHIPIK